MLRIVLFILVFFLLFIRFTGQLHPRSYSSPSLTLANLSPINPSTSPQRKGNCPWVNPTLGHPVTIAVGSRGMEWEPRITQLKVSARSWQSPQSPGLVGGTRRRNQGCTPEVSVPPAQLPTHGMELLHSLQAPALLWSCLFELTAAQEAILVSLQMVYLHFPRTATYILTTGHGFQVP